MPRRTVEAHKAIRLAWQREYELVQEGKGTRDWTAEQQQDILDPDRGKAYDDSGRAFEGQHMKSAEKYPEYQGDPGNIQFLTREEHLAAHRGSWQTSTNWYYDPVTKKFFDFDEDTYIPCKVIKLSNPIASVEDYKADRGIDPIEPTEKEASSGADLQSNDSRQSGVADSTNMNPKKPQGNQGAKRNVISGAKDAFASIKELPNKHPVLTAFTGGGIIATAVVVAGKAIGTNIKINHSSHGGHSMPRNQTVKIVKEAVVDAVKKLDFKKAESVIKQIGYTVAKSAGLSDVDRQKILQDIIEKGIMTKEALCSFLEKNINLHKNQGSFAEAVGKWTADLVYVRENL